MSESADTRHPTLFLLDGYALLYRAFYAMINRPLTTSSGENTSAPFGMARFLIRLLEDYRPEYVGLVLDAGDSFRSELLPEYKATRAKMPEEMQASLPACREIVEGFRVPVIEMEGWEADDVIGTLAGQAAERGVRTVIVSGDKDFYQLVGPNTVLLNPGRRGPAGVEQEWITLDNASERLGVPPDRVTDYLALLGDASDNVPGVRGIGAKTAPRLIEQFGTLEDILAHADQIAGARIRAALLEQAESARLSKKLVTIRSDVPIQLKLEALRVRPPDRSRLRDAFLKLEFHNLIREIPTTEPAEPKQGATYELVRTVADAREAAGLLTGAEEISLEVVATPGDPLRSELVGLALCGETGLAFYLPLGHRPPKVARDEAGNPTLALSADPVRNLPPLIEPRMSEIRALLESGVSLIGHDLKRQLLILERAGLRPSVPRFDTALASYCLDPGKRDHSLDLLVMDRLGRELTTRADVCGSGRAATPIDEISPEAVLRHACERADHARRLALVLEPELRAHEMLELFTRVEMPLIPVLAAMEKVGIALDLDFFRRFAARLDRELRLVMEEIRKIVGREVNLRSVPQMRELLFDTLGLPVVKKTKTGPSTDESVLVELAQRGHRIPRLILEHRELDKLNSTYVSKLPELVNPETGRIHTTFNQTVAATGRLSSSDPNLQNIPIRSSLGREIRKGFVAAPGYALLAADYSQIELRILAHLSGDAAFVKAFREGRDIHTETAARIFGVDAARVDGDMRARAKTINFATIYGQGPSALAGQLGISRTEAQAFIEQYFQRFSGVAAYLEEMKRRAREKGYVETLIGRRRYIPEIRSQNPGVRGFGERTATNSPIQGSAADLIKLAMIRLHARLPRDRAPMLLQVHDELLFEVEDAAVDEIGGIVREEMEGAVELDVPLRVDIGVGPNWFVCKEEPAGR
ncbi:MAG: DNA polymerase I [Gemmatimonadota bacterium]